MPRLQALRAFTNVRFDSSIPHADPSLPIRERLTVLMHLRDAIMRIKPDYVLVPSADAQTLAMGTLGHLGLSLLPKHISTEATFHYGYGPALATLKHFMKEAVYRFSFSGSNWTHLNFINFLYYEYILRQRCRWAERARMVPHPVPKAARLPRTEARRLLGIPQDGRYIGLLGSLDPRKTVPELLIAFRGANLGATDRLLLAGRLDPLFRDLIAKEYNDLLKSERLVVIDRFLTENELTQGYGALDVVCATYRDFPGAASLMLRGIAAGRPVIAQDFGWPRAVIKRFKVGRTTDVTDIDRFSQDLRKALEESANYTELEGTKRLLTFHDPSNFIETMTDRIRQQSHKAQRHPLHTWNWVLEAVDPEYRSLY